MTLPNSQIGPYTVTKIIGQTLLSTVCRATNGDKNQDVMLKVFVPDGANSTAAFERFIEEGENIKRFSHDNIPTVYEVGEANKQHFIAFEFITERTLASYLTAQEDRALPIDEVINILHQIGSGLAYIHDRGYIHRDIKPEHILYSEDSRISILDFGLAKHADTNDSRSIFTIAGGSIGTLDYISPEQARGEMNIDHRSDIYSLAVIAYELFSGRLPHHAPSHHELLYKIIYETPPSLEKTVSNIPDGISYAIDRALSKDIPVRYGSARSFAEAVEEGKTWMPSAAAYEFLTESTSANAYTASSQGNQQIPYDPFNMQMPSKNKNSKMPFLLAMLVGFTALSFISIYLLSQQQLGNQAPNQSASNETIATSGSTNLERDFSILPSIQETSERTQVNAIDAEVALSDSGLDTVVDEVVANILENSDAVNSNKSNSVGSNIDKLDIDEIDNTDLDDPLLNESESGEINTSAINSDWLAPYNRYLDPQNRFSLEVPILWRRNVSLKSVNFDSSDPFARIFVRDMDTPDPDRSPELLIQQYIESNANSFNNLALIENSSKRIENGSFQQKYGAVWLNKEVTLTLNTISGDEKAYILGLVVESEINDKISADFERVVNSFALTSSSTILQNDQTNSRIEAIRSQNRGELLAAIPLQTSTRQALSTRATVTVKASDELSPPTTSTPFSFRTSTPEAEDEADASLIAESTDTTSPTSTAVSTSTNTVTPTPTAASTNTVESTLTIQPTDTAIPIATAQPTRVSIPTTVAAIVDFEEFGQWKLGTQPWGTFTQSDQQIYSGDYAGQFIYEFPASAANQNYLAFFRTVSIEGEPDALRMQVYGDGSGVFLHVWIMDATDQIWQFTFGNIEHVGWQEMIAPLSLERGWPNGLIGNNAGESSTIQYPISLFALSVDGLDDGTLQRGAIYVDDLAIIPNSVIE